MVTEVDRRGNHHNRQPEYFFNGIIGHIRAGQNGWIDSWDQSSQLANYWRRYFQIPEISPYGNWHPPSRWSSRKPRVGAWIRHGWHRFYHCQCWHQSTSRPDTSTGNVPLEHSQQWQGGRTMAILERLEDTEGDLSRHPVQIFSAADLAHLASHLAESTRTLSNQARRMEALPDEGLWALGLIHLMFLPCILQPFPLQGTDNSLHRV